MVRLPQLSGLGRSPMARRFGIGGAAEALAYLRHPLLGARLEECCELVLAVRDRTALQIFGTPDDIKFRSSMTLFANVAAGVPVFDAALARFFGGEVCTATLELLRRGEAH